MNYMTRYLLLSASLYVSIFPVFASDAHWSYQGNHGPAHWGELGNALCASGTHQSPINVQMKALHPQKGDKQALSIHYGEAALTVVNNGHTIQATVPEGETVRFQNTEYHLAQFHFHTPSEHQRNGSSYPMEMHLVNKDATGQLLVIGVMVKEGRKNTELASLWQHLPKTQGEETTLSASDAPNLGKLLPAASHHLFYKGSLTTPPCTEGVQWVLIEQPIEMSKSQINQFRKLFPKNNRPVQKTNHREVIED
ncbi:carbonic anhydrase family protein [Pseudomonas koreensis]|nr:carbonic anhydrase family protein [Pseudomonas koreensis]